MIKNKSYLKRVNIQKITSIVVILLITIIGTKYLLSSHAQSPNASVNASAGTITGIATTQTDNNGNYVQFGFTPTTALAVHVDGDQLINGQGMPMRLLGVDADNTEFCAKHHTVSDALPLDSAEADDIHSWKINAVRIPLNEDCWLGINGVTINGESSAASAQTYQTAIENWVNDLNNAGIVAILDLHWGAPGANLAYQQWPMADSDNSPNFWSSVATAFKSNPSVMFDLFNEPYLERTNITISSSPWSCWLNGCNVTFTPTVDIPTDPISPSTTLTPITYKSAGMQELVNSVRSTGASQPIILGGLNTSGDPCGLGVETSDNEPGSDKDGSTASCTELANLPTDPDKQLVIDFHNYQYGGCSDTTCWTNTLNALSAAKIPMVTDEFGEEDCTTSFMNTYMQWADSNNISYLAWSWNVPPSTATPPLNCPGAYDPNNFYLLGDWNGDPSTLIPEGTYYQSHLAMVSPY